MPHKFYKHKLLLDEGLYPRQYLKRTNSRYDVKHIKHDLNALLNRSTAKSLYNKYTSLSLSKEEQEMRAT